MSRESRVFVSYVCPHCQARLEAKTAGWDGWLRCPECDRPSLPPDPEAEWLERVHNDVLRHSENAIVYLPGSPDPAVEPFLAPPAPQGRSLHTSPARLIFTTGFALSLFLVLMAFLDRRTVNMTIFGFLAIVFFVLLVRWPRHRPER